MSMATTIQVSDELIGTLRHRKLYDNETYEEVIWDLIEDTLELSEETKRDIAKAEQDLKAGRVHSLEDVEKRLKR